MSEDKPKYEKMDDEQIKEVGKSIGKKTNSTKKDSLKVSSNFIVNPLQEPPEQKIIDELGFTHVIAMYKHHPKAKWQVFPRLFTSVEQAHKVLKTKVIVTNFKAITVELPPEN